MGLGRGQIGLACVAVSREGQARAPVATFQGAAQYLPGLVFIGNWAFYENAIEVARVVSIDAFRATVRQNPRGRFGG